MREDTPIERLARAYVVAKRAANAAPDWCDAESDVAREAFKHLANAVDGTTPIYSTSGLMKEAFDKLAAQREEIARLNEVIDEHSRGETYDAKLARRYEDMRAACVAAAAVLLPLSSGLARQAIQILAPYTEGNIFEPEDSPEATIATLRAEHAVLRNHARTVAAFLSAYGAHLFVGTATEMLETAARGSQDEWQKAYGEAEVLKRLEVARGILDDATVAHETRVAAALAVLK